MRYFTASGLGLSVVPLAVPPTFIQSRVAFKTENCEGPPQEWLGVIQEIFLLKLSLNQTFSYENENIFSLRFYGFF